MPKRKRQRTQRFGYLVHPDDVQFGSRGPRAGWWRGYTQCTRAVARDLVNTEFAHLLEDAKNERVSLLVIMNEQLQKVEKSFKYFENTILEGMADQLAIYKAFRLFDPARIDALGQNANEVEAQLASIPFFDANEVAALIGHLPAYRALAVGEAVDDNVDREAWWASKAHTAGVDRWYKGAAMVMICQCSSAAAERVFSVLKALMGAQQCGSAKEDYQEAALFSRYNGLQRGEV
jgi:hypothetical protein